MVTKSTKDTSVESQLDSFKKAVTQITPTALKGTRGLVQYPSIQKTTFGDIGGLENVKNILQQSVLWQMENPEAFTRLGIPMTKGILLYGPPGCAKTSLVKALANEANATFLAVSAADIYSPYVGESEKRLSKLFTQARIAIPSIIFIDEIDSLVGSKGMGREHGVQERILATLLIEMDGVGLKIITSDSLTKVAEEEDTDQEINKFSNKVSNAGIIVIGASNRPELIDDALKRPGRFDKMIYVPPPDEKERLAILKTLTSKMAIASDVNLDAIAKKTEHCSGADLKSICVESGLLALTDRGLSATQIVSQDFSKVLLNFRPSLVLDKNK